MQMRKEKRRKEKKSCLQYITLQRQPQYIWCIYFKFLFPICVYVIIHTHTHTYFTKRILYTVL